MNRKRHSKLWASMPYLLLLLNLGLVSAAMSLLGTFDKPFIILFTSVGTAISISLFSAFKRSASWPRCGR